MEISSELFHLATNINPQPNNKLLKNKSKTTIPPRLKENVWITYCGNIVKTNCLVCEAIPISCFSFDCGHVIAESNGGSLDVSNLRPICGSCNSSMSTKDMKDYAEKFYPKSPILLTFTSNIDKSTTRLPNNPENISLKKYQPRLSNSTDMINFIIKKGTKKITKKEIEILTAKFFLACACGYLDVVNLLIHQEVINWEMGFYESCRNGHLDIVNFIIQQKSTDLDSGMNIACERGHLDIVNLLIYRGARNWNKGLATACRGGNIDIVNLMIAKGATDFTESLPNACFSGNLDIVNLLIEKGVAEDYIFDWNDSLIDACRGGHLHVVNLIIEKGVIECCIFDWNNCLCSSCEKNKPEVPNLIIEKGEAEGCIFDWNRCLSIACDYSYYKVYSEIISLMIEKGANYCNNCKSQSCRISLVDC